jgi:hypothetical protein
MEILADRRMITGFIRQGIHKFQHLNRCKQLILDDVAKSGKLKLDKAFEHNGKELQPGKA